MIVPPNQWWPARYICIPIWSAMHRSRVAAMQYHCCVVDWQCRAQALTLPRTRLDPPVGHQSIHAHNRTPPTPRGTPMLPWSTNSIGGSILVDGAQSTIGIQGPWIVHEADRAIRVTHLLSCTNPIYSWHGQAPPHVATHHALAHSWSISLDIWYLHAGFYA